MNRYIKPIVILTLSLLVCFIKDVVFAEESTQPVMVESMYSDVKAREIGDILTVIISESNTASKNAQTNSNKQNTADTQGTATTGVLDGLFPGIGGSMDLSTQFRGQASTTRNGSLSSELSVRVVDVLPNNNLVIEGTKTMEINEDLEVVTLSGVVQPEYISSSNTIYSYQIANAKMTYKGKGSITQGNRIGILGRILNWIF